MADANGEIDKLHSPECLPALNEARWENHNREHVYHQEAHAREHQAATERVDLATRVLNERLDTMNAFRDQITRERNEYVRADMFEQYKQTSAVEMANLTERISKMEVYRGTLEGRMWAIGAVAAFFASMLSIGIAIYV